MYNSSVLIIKLEHRYHKGNCERVTECLNDCKKDSMNLLPKKAKSFIFPKYLFRNKKKLKMSIYRVLLALVLKLGILP